MPKNTTEKCCPECASRSIPENNPGCAAWDCPCHTTTENGWEKSFDKLTTQELIEVRDLGVRVAYKVLYKDEVKVLIQHIAKEEYEKGRKDSVHYIKSQYKWIGGVKKPKILVKIEKWMDEAALEAPNEEQHG